jgi:hypothetical protein
MEGYRYCQRYEFCRHHVSTVQSRHESGPEVEVHGTMLKRIWLGLHRVHLAFAALLAAGLFLLAPASASAHVKWFHGEDHGLQTELIFGWNTLAVIIASVGALATLALLQWLLGDRYWPHIRFLDRMSIGAPTLLAVQAAITLIHAAVQPALFAPNMALAVTVVGLTFATIQVLIALSFITGVADWLAAIVLILLGPVALFIFPVIDVVEQLLWAGIGIFFLVIGRYSVYPEHARQWFQGYGPNTGHYAVTALRVLTGLSFVALGLGEKLWNMEMAVGFLDDNPELNFIYTYLGIEWFDNELFAFSAGLTEAVIGVLLISGVLTRVVILGMWLPFNLGLPFLPPQELLGHLPIFGIMYVLLVYNPHRPDHFEPRDEPSEDPPSTTEESRIFR